MVQKWNEDIIVNELKRIINIKGYFPSGIELAKSGRYDLVNAVKRHGGFTKFRNLLGYKSLHKSKGYWTYENTLKELQEVINQLGHFPTENQLQLLHKHGLINSIKNHGGYIKFRNLLGYNIIQKPSGYWTDQKIIEELKKIISKLNYFPTHTKLRLEHRYDLCMAISRNGGINKFHELIGYESIQKPNGYWTEEKIVEKLKEIKQRLGHFPTSTDLICKQDLVGAINKHGGINKYRELLGYTMSIHDKYISELASYCSKRGKSTENIIKQILIDYCELHHIPEPQYNIKLSKGNVLEFVCNTGKTIGIDVTNTKIVTTIYQKWKRQEYHKHLDELWIVVFSNTFTEQDYIKFNNKSPENVKIFSIYDFLNELNYSLDMHTKNKIDKYCSCTFHTKDELKREK